MAPRTKAGEKADENDEILIALQAQTLELQEELKRVNTQRIESHKENETLRAEIRRMKDTFEKQLKSRTVVTGAGGTRTDVGAQTENVNIDVGKQIIDIERDQARHCDMSTNNSMLNLGNNNNRFNDRNSRDNYFENNRQETSSNLDNQTVSQDHLMRGLMSYFESLQISIPLPKFDGVKKNPIEFIKDLEKYFVRKNIPENLKLILIEDALIGKAKMCHDARAFPFTTFQYFKEKFLEEFYSIEARMNAKSEWENRRFLISDGSLQAYYTEQLRGAKFCLSTLAEYEINYLIVKQLPQRAREALVTIDYNDTSKILQALARLDVTRRDIACESSSGSKENSHAAISNNDQKSNSGLDNTKDNNSNKKNESHSNSQFKPRYNEGDRFRNWRQGETIRDKHRVCKIMIMILENKVLARMVGKRRIHLVKSVRL